MDQMITDGWFLSRSISSRIICAWKVLGRGADQYGSLKVGSAMPAAENTTLDKPKFWPTAGTSSADQDALLIAVVMTSLAYG